MKKSLFVLIATGVLAGSVFAQTAVPAVNAAASKVAAAPAAIASAAKPAAATAATTVPAAGGGAGKVWVNGKVYHCEGSKYYGKTKKGEYMAEADAKAKGAHGVKGQVCSK